MAWGSPPEPGTVKMPGSVEGYLPHFDLLAGSAQVREHLEASGPVDELTCAWASDLDSFAGLREPYLLYQGQ